MSITAILAKRRAKAKAALKKSAPKPALKKMAKKKEEEICDKEGCERPAVECEGHVDCDPCEDQ